MRKSVAQNACGSGLIQRQNVQPPVARTNHTDLFRIIFRTRRGAFLFESLPTRWPATELNSSARRGSASKRGAFFRSAFFDLQNGQHRKSFSLLFLLPRSFLGPIGRILNFYFCVSEVGKETFDQVGYPIVCR